MIDDHDAQKDNSPVVRVKGITLRYGKVAALDNVNLDIPPGCMVGFIGPDGVGKSSLLSLIAGARIIQEGDIELFGGKLTDKSHRTKILPRIAFMPQGLGKNLYPTLSVYENVDFFGRLFGQGLEERRQRIDALLQATGLLAFKDRPAGKLSGGMKQKLSLCCALIHDPDILILDEPTTGVDPLSRRLFWELVERIRRGHPGMSVLVATAYLEEAQSFEWLVAMNAGHILFTGTLKDLFAKTASSDMEKAFIALLPKAEQEAHRPVVIPKKEKESEEIAIEADQLTMRFGDFTAVDHVNFCIKKGEIFGFLGSNGCGKTTTMKMLTGLLPPSEGEAKLFGQPIDPHDLNTRQRVGYMSQSFSLYTELTVKQNLILHARLFKMAEVQIPARVEQMSKRFDLGEVMDSFPDDLPLGQRQRLSLAVAIIHSPELLILDEPTSGVDPVARDNFWQILLELSRKESVTIFISTHFMNEAARCDRISLMHAGHVLASDSPEALIEKREAKTLEEAFISYLKEASQSEKGEEVSEQPSDASFKKPSHSNVIAEHSSPFSWLRLTSYILREAKELRRDTIRLTLSLAGCIFLMITLSYGITLDVENLSFAVLDRDQTILSRNYVLNLAGAKRYFIEHAPIKDYKEMDHRMRSGEVSIAIEIPPHFARDVCNGRAVSVGTWVDGAMPRRAEIIKGYVEGAHQLWLRTLANQGIVVTKPDLITIENRFLYNPDVKSIPAMVPAVIPLLLLFIPAILCSLAVVREKELGSIINLYVTPVTKLEFLFGKLIPYIIIAIINYLLMLGLAFFLFKVPVKGNIITLSIGTLLYAICSTSLGFFASTFTKSQIAALFATSVLTLLPAINFSGLVDPVTSLEGMGAFIGRIYPTTYYMVISRGTFSKGLGFEDLGFFFIPLLLTTLLLIGLGVGLLKKQEK